MNKNIELIKDQIKLLNDHDFVELATWMSQHGLIIMQKNLVMMQRKMDDKLNRSYAKIHEKSNVKGKITLRDDDPMPTE